MKRVLGAAAFAVVGLVMVLLIPFLWLASAPPAVGLPVLISLEGVDLGVDNAHIADRRLDREQAANAYYITCAAVWRAGNPRAAVIAIATALQESSLRNLGHGDAAGPSSRGLFQQMIEYYGEAVALDPIRATEAFLDRLLNLPGWDTLPLTVAAATVQRPREDLRGEYADEEPAAQVIVNLLWERIVELGPGACRPALVGQYALPIAPEWFQAHPDWVTAPHHTYPAADLPVPTGTPIYAMVGGVVIASPAGGDCGDGVIIAGDDGLRYTYCHGLRPLVPRGARVPAGQPIMLSGYSGRVVPDGPAGAHLHLQINLGDTLLCPQPALASLVQRVPITPAMYATSGCVGGSL